MGRSSRDPSSGCRSWDPAPPSMWSGGSDSPNCAGCPDLGLLAAVLGEVGIMCERPGEAYRVDAFGLEESRERFQRLLLSGPRRLYSHTILMPPTNEVLRKVVTAVPR